MRKLIILTLATILLLSCAYAESEFTFQNIPWLSDVTSVITRLSDCGFITKDRYDFVISNEKSIYIAPNDIINYSPKIDNRYSDICLSLSLEGTICGKIAGYPVKDLIPSFAYNGGMQLISVNVCLIGATYESLENKLNKVYGEGEKIETEDGIRTSIWKSENNTAILLYSEGLDYTLLYGRLDADEILQSCLEADPKDISGL